MNIEEFCNFNEDLRRKHTYNLFLDNANKTFIKRLFILKSKEKFDSSLLSIALSATIVNKHQELFDLIFEFIEKSNKKLEWGDARALLNIALIKEHDEMIKYLDTKYGIIEKDFNENREVTLLEDGRVSRSFGTSDGYYEPPFNSLDNFYGNTFSYHITNGNEEVLNTLLDKGYLIKESMIESEFFEQVGEGNMKGLMILLANNEFRKVIEHSSNIKLYFNEPTEDMDMKTEIKNILNVMNLKNKMTLDLKEKNKKNSKNKI